MNSRELLIAGLALFIGACAGAALAPARAQEHAEPPRSVVNLASAPHALAPHGKAEIHHLARGVAAYLGLLRLQAGALVPSHRDETEEYIYVLEGAGTMSIDGERFEVSPNTAVFMPAHAEVSFQNGDAPMVALQVFAGPGPSAKYATWTAVAPTEP